MPLHMEFDKDFTTLYMYTAKEQVYKTYIKRLLYPKGFAADIIYCCYYESFIHFEKKNTHGGKPLPELQTDRC